VLQDELRSQEPLYDKFIKSGHAILDKCEPDSKDAAHISEKLDVISHGWDRLQARLKDRNKSLHAVEGLSLDFSDSVRKLGGWLSEHGQRLEDLAPVSGNPETRQQQLDEITVRILFI
jgi:hypothetical protein